MSNVISPAIVNMTIPNGLGIYQGASWNVPITVTERENLVDTPVDLTGYTGRCSIKKYAGDDTPIATPLVTITSALQGQFVISLTAAETENMLTRGRTWRDVEVFQYDVYLDKNNQSFRALQGEIEVSPTVTETDDEE